MISTTALTYVVFFHTVPSHTLVLSIFLIAHDNNVFNEVLPSCYCWFGFAFFAKSQQKY